ncbi:MAG TPA: histidine kinase [Holophagaceae bacterium]|jgi:two-component system LytT family sensor kinase|nr:histidine kinase [Holophagaceae bacterium]
MIRRHQAWILYWGGWLLIGGYVAAMDATVLSEGPVDLTRLITVDILLHLIWGAMVLVVIRSLKRYPLGDFSTWPRWVFHLGLSLTFTVVGLAAAFTISQLFRGLPTVPKAVLWHQFARFFWRYFHLALMDFLIAIGAYTAVDMYRRFKARELQSSQLEARLAQAHNAALRMELQPHFLFNALHSVSALIDRDPAAADRMLSRLGDLLRQTLDLSGKQEISLRQELAVLQNYIEIQRIRFLDRLQVRVDCPETLLEAQVPSFMLQPQVENALKHGLAKRSGSGLVVIRARAESGALILEVEDDGCGLSGLPPRPGIGTANTKARLELLYGEDQSFELLPVSTGGTLARIRLPLHDAPSIGPQKEGASEDGQPALQLLPAPR